MVERFAWVIVLIAVLAGCNDEPVIGAGDDPEMDAEDPEPDPMAGEEMDPEPEPMDMRPPIEPMDMGPPACPPPEFVPDEAQYAANIADLIVPACVTCHPASPPAPTFNLADDPALDNAECATFVSSSCLDDPESCDIIAWHPEGHPGYVIDPLRTGLAQWITAGTVTPPCPDPNPDPEPPPPPPEPDMGPDDVVPCEALPPEGAELARSPQFREEFSEPDFDGVSHNDILVGSCARNGTCHAIAGEGDGYWLIEGDDECAENWNFFISQIYIDLLSPETSPLLTLPRDRDGHGGRSVFRGADDERHVRLLRWIEAEIIRSR